MRSGLAVALTAALSTAAGNSAKDARSEVLKRAQVWSPTNIASVDLFNGPQEPGAFAPNETVTCTYVRHTSTGHSPKFWCRRENGDEFKVKFGGGNGEVYGEVIATRLLWALGFGADRMYSVNLICRGCPAQFGGIARPNSEQRFAPATIERKAPGAEWKKGGEGWAWSELDAVDPAAGGAPQEQRDALKLVAVLLQHTDSKRQQQRIVCLDQQHEKHDSCDHPFLMIDDLGLTFGHATHTNSDSSSTNLVAWKGTPVWRDQTGCVGNLPKSFTGTLENPVISEEGRAFLANLLMQLSDRQIADMFRAAQVDQRLRQPGHALSGLATVEEWVGAFKAKRQEIAARHCQPA